MIWILIWSILLLILIWIILYNSFVKKYHAVKNAAGTIEVYLQKRSDLIPNLVEVCKGYAKHEQELFEKVVEARNRAIHATKLNDKLSNDQRLEKQINQVLLLKESYPELKADKLFLNLQKELAQCEENIAASRRFMNTAAADYNQAIASFPGNIIARNGKYKPFVYFEADDKEVPEIKL